MSGTLGICYAGIIFVFIQDLKLGGVSIVLGTSLVLGAAITYAIYLLGSGEMVKRVGSLRLVSYAMCVSSMACIVQFFILKPVASLWQPMPVITLSLINAFFCTVLPVVMTMIAVEHIGASTASQAGMIGPVSTLFLAAWLLGEPITPWQIAGTVLVVAGIFLLSKKK